MSNSGLASIDAIIHRACAAAGMADAAVYRAPGSAIDIPCRVYVNKAMQQMGDYGQVIGSRTLVDLLRADVPDPQQYATVTVGTEVFALESEQPGSDESMSRWVVGNG